MSGLVTVIVPCFNYARFLKECVESLRAQSYAHWECIIIDDGSTDETPQVCRELSATEPRVSFARQANAGLSAARNAGVRLARGDFLQFLDADDLLEPDKLNVQREFLERHAEFDIVVGGAAYIRGHAPFNPRSWPSDMWPRESNEEAVLAAFVRQNVCPVNAVLLRHAVLETVGGFDESLPAHEDWDMWLRCLLRGQKFAFVSAGRDRALVRQHGANMSAARRLLRRTPREAMSRTAIQVRERLQSSLPDNLRPGNASLLAKAKWTLGLDLVRAGRFREGWKLYKEGLSESTPKVHALLGLLLLFPGAPTAVRLNRWLLRSLH